VNLFSSGTLLNETSAKGYELLRFVYCEWNVKRIPKGRWNSSTFTNPTIMSISACGRKNCWVSIKDWHLIKARILAIWLSLFAANSIWVYWRLKCGGGQTSHSIDSRCVNLLASCVNIWVCSKDVYRSNKCILQIGSKYLEISNPWPPMQCELRWVFAYWTNG
jgi:hypothetical protein